MYHRSLFAVAPPAIRIAVQIVEKTEHIKILDLNSGQVPPTPFLDLSGQIAIARRSNLEMAGLRIKGEALYKTLRSPTIDTFKSERHIQA